MENLQKTFLYDKHKELNARMVGFCGWDMPVQYESIIKEHKACREDVAIFDISHMGEFFFKGDIEDSGVNESVTQDLVKLPVGKCKYGFLLNQNGGVIDDMIIYKLADDELMFVVNAARREIDFETIKSRLSSGTFEDKSDEISKIDVQGPNSKEILREFFKDDLDSLGYFSFVKTKFEDMDCLLSRTGYTGELGYELYVDNESAPVIWEKLLQKGATPAGLGARDILRLEKGYSLYGHELNEETTPLESGLGFFINYETPFVGKEALLKQKQEGITKKIIAFKTASRRAPKAENEIYQNGKKIGVVTSGAYSPILGCGIGLGFVNLEDFNKDEELEIRDNRGAIKASVTKLPFL